MAMICRENKLSKLCRLLKHLECGPRKIVYSLAITNLVFFICEVETDKFKHNLELSK